MVNKKQHSVFLFLKMILMSIATTLAFWGNYHGIYVDVSEYDSVTILSELQRWSIQEFIKGYTFIKNLIGEESSAITVGILFFIGYYLIYYKIYNVEKVKLSKIMSAILAGCYVVGKIYLEDVTVLNVGLTQPVKMVVFFIGFYCFYYVLIHYFYLFIEKYNDYFKEGFYVKRPMTITFIYLFVVWIPHLIIKYPAGIDWDSWAALEMGMGDKTISEHFPVFYEILLADFTKLGIFLGDANIGIFIYAIIEMIIFAWIVSYGISILLKIKANKYLIIYILCFFGFSPFVVGYVGAILKDFYYAIFCLLFILLLIEYCYDRDAFWKSKGKIFLFVLSAVFIVLFRRNGIYIIVPTIFSIIIFEWKKGVVRQEIIKKLLIYLVMILLPMGINSAYNNYYNAEKEGPVEALSIPLQQTARLVKYNSKIITEEERKIIDNVMVYDSLAEQYNPYISDPVKRCFRNDYTNEELMEYFVLWARLGLRDPATYVAATVQQNILLVCPEGDDFYPYYLNFNATGYQYTGEAYFDRPEQLAYSQGVYELYLRTLHTLPILYIVNNIATYTIAFLILIIFIFTKKDYKQLILVVPILLSLLVIIAGPCVRSTVRYCFPIIFTVPFMVGYYTSRIKLANKNNSDE